MDVRGQIAVVTGAGSGLGEATARHLAAQGARVAVFDANETAAQAVAQDIDGLSVFVDVTDQTAVEAGFAKTLSTFGDAPRIVVNCAGVALGARVVGREGKMSFDVFEKTLKVNLFGTYNVMSHGVRHMLDLPVQQDGERGVVINTASIAYEDGQFGQTAYAASKGAVAAMCLPAARELAASAVRVVAIAPGLFGTPMMQSLPDEVTDKITGDVPFPARLGDPREYGLMVEHIVTNPYLNGTTIRLDGALRLPPR
ncbi:SDR family NAD(P)-dependent oxidoreductase [Epibacterium sp. SM1979]|uniref:SDR family NAD(P)-dependent oxidoreductase n=1 Tax=Tritonibacter litoralis TaxID=2662264 RepID=A0A843YIA7_9RHOB|nr:SDR family NAD(P)-dependent oxidoreductase [Tritonibacter litoralis]MQQ08869.1 SDR family NAD(P)-dependent oxidoreductase [Tritonibacter litoralis]